MQITSTSVAALAATAAVRADRAYVDHRRTFVGSYSTRDATGVVYAVCR